jgi:lauroyl/myristoyl acyltransferase
VDAEAMLAKEDRRRRRIPSPVAVAVAVARGRRAWRDPQARAGARAAIEAIVGNVPERDALARRHLVETAVREELIWRPWQLSGARLDGRAHLEDALATRRGVIASFVHSGPFPGVGGALAEVSDRTHTVVGGWLHDRSDDRAEERRRLRWRANLGLAGASVIEAAGSYAAIAALLRAGELVAMGFDVPGTDETEFIGRRIALVSGTARLAFETGALVVPVWRARDRWRPLTIAAPAVDPAGHATWQELHAALASIHSRWILARPAELENPCRPGWWGAAT